MAIALAAPGVRGQPPPPGELVTDRPDQTESAEVVAPGWVQVEAGWLHTRDESDGLRSETDEVPGTLVRIGLAERLELRLGWAGWIEEEVEGRGGRSVAEGGGDLELGGKLVLWEERGRRPRGALLAAVNLPTGAAALTSDRYDPSLRLSLAHSLPRDLSLGYNLEVSRGEEGSVVAYTAALGIGLTERLGAFVELFGDLPADAPGGPAHSADGGWTFLLTEDLQLDLAGGVGLSREAPDWFVGLGISARFRGWPPRPERR